MVCRTLGLATVGDGTMRRRFCVLLGEVITPEIGEEIVRQMPWSATPENARVGYEYRESEAEGEIYFFGTLGQWKRYRDEVRGLAMGMLIILAAPPGIKAAQ